MKLFVKVQPNSKTEKIERIDENHWSVRVKAKPKDGRANEAVVEALAAHFKIPKSCVTLIKGRTSKHKIFYLAGL